VRAAISEIVVGFAQFSQLCFGGLAHRRAGIGRRGIARRPEAFPEEGDGGARRRNRSAVGERSNKAFLGVKLYVCYLTGRMRLSG